MLNLLKRFNQYLNDNRSFWWIMGLVNSISFALHLVAGNWGYAAGTGLMMGWSIYELNRIQKENNNGES